jgi:hypothetical protein
MDGVDGEESLPPSIIDQLGMVGFESEKGANLDCGANRNQGEHKQQESIPETDSRVGPEDCRRRGCLAIPGRTLG